MLGIKYGSPARVEDSVNHLVISPANTHTYTTNNTQHTHTLFNIHWDGVKDTKMEEETFSQEFEDQGWRELRAAE